MTSQLQVNHREDAYTQTAESNRKSLYLAGSVAALMAGLLLLLAMISLVSSAIQPGVMIGWLLPFQDNWLIVIFKLHAGFGDTQINLLHILNFLDLAVLALVGTMLLGLYAAIRRISRVWSMIALALPFLGMVLFIATKTAGRSAVMGAVLIVSIVMLRNKIFNRATAYMGIMASLLLLLGDFTAGVLHSNIITALFGIGYLLLMTWIFLIARRLFQLGQNAKG
jgi:hypothetical protein